MTKLPPLSPETVDIIDLDRIDADDRLRPVDEAHMLAIAASIREIGLQQPILVRPCDDGYILVAGAHRLAAARHLGLPGIAALIEEFNPDQARLAEIDENLCRRELSALDRAIFLTEREEVYLRLFPQAGHGGKKGKSNQYVRKAAKLASFHSFAEDAAAKSGLSVRSIQRATQLLDGLTTETIKALRLHPVANNASELQRIGRLDAERQQLIVAELTRADGAESVRAASLAAGLIAPAEATTDRQQVDRIMTAVRRLPASAQGLLENDVRDWLAERDAERQRRKNRRTGSLPGSDA